MTIICHIYKSAHCIGIRFLFVQLQKFRNLAFLKHNIYNKISKDGAIFTLVFPLFTSICTSGDGENKVIFTGKNNEIIRTIPCKIVSTFGRSDIIY